MDKDLKALALMQTILDKLNNFQAKDLAEVASEMLSTLENLKTKGLIKDFKISNDGRVSITFPEDGYSGDIEKHLYKVPEFTIH